MRTARPDHIPPRATNRVGRGLGALVATGAIAFVAAACGSPAATPPGNSTSGTTSPSCATLLSAGLTAQNQGAPSTATTDYDSVLSECPGSRDAAYAFYDLGVIAQNAGNDSTAQQNYDSSLAIVPAQPDALYNLAIIVTKTNPNEAIDDYTNAISYFGADKATAADSYLNRGFIERGLGETAKANADFAKATRLDPALASRITPPTNSSTSTT